MARYLATMVPTAVVERNDWRLARVQAYTRRSCKNPLKQRVLCRMGSVQDVRAMSCLYRVLSCMNGES
ncbi:hypothetical protein JOC55_001719 [Paenibacillus sacheonensis]|nr:hypothetical protein [Paenibacillus sacheonensis]